MKRVIVLAAILAPALAAASVPIEPARETIGQALGRIAAEISAAEARVATLQKREAAANDEAGRLRAERERAAAASARARRSARSIGSASGPTGVLAAARSAGMRMSATASK